MSTKQLIGLFVSIKLCFLPSKLESYIHLPWLYIGTVTRLAKAGFAVYGMDYEGHGKLAGLAGSILGGLYMYMCAEYFWLKLN